MRAAEASGGRPAAGVRLDGLRKAFGDAQAVVDFTLDVAPGSFTTLLGPSGCGKTTALRMVAGFVEADGGRVLIDGVDQTGVPSNRRGVGMVFQDYALFPHMSVRANVEYGLRRHRVAAPARRERVERTLELLDLSALKGRFPFELSGGQQQRVALGRAIVLEPRVLLMDEPFSNLDAKLRLRLRAELRVLQRQLGITTLYVTHDQEEALSLSDQVVVMDLGRIQQAGAPADVYRRPANRFVAEFVGHANLLPVRAEGEAGGSLSTTALDQPLAVRLPDARRPARGAAGLAMVRPEQVRLAPTAREGGWRADARVVSRGFFGAFERYWLALEGVREPWLVDVPLGEPGGAADLEEGATVTVRLLPGAATWLW